MHMNFLHSVFASISIPPGFDKIPFHPQHTESAKQYQQVFLEMKYSGRISSDR